MDLTFIAVDVHCVGERTLEQIKLTQMDTPARARENNTHIHIR